MSLKYRWDRFNNKRLNEKEFKRRELTLRSYPTIAYIDPANACPLSCPLCPTGNRSSKDPRGIMSMASFKKIYDQIGPYLYQLHLYNWGEPTLNKVLPEMIEYAKRHHNPKIVISTSLAKISAELAETLATSQANLLSVSVDGIDQETYEKYRVGGDLAHVFKTLELMVAAQRRSNKKCPVIRWQFIPMKHNEHQLEQSREKAKALGIDFRVHRVRLQMTNFDKPGDNQQSQDVADFAPTDEKHRRPITPLTPENPCKWLWNRVVYDWDGRITPCCNVQDSNDAFEADINVPFLSTWNGKAYRDARNIFHSVRTEGHSVCQRCVDNSGVL